MSTMRVPFRFAAGLMAFVVAFGVQGQESGAGGLSALEPAVGSLPVAVPAKYDFPDLKQVDSVEPIGASVSTFDVGSMSNFRRAFFIDQRAFVLQLPGTGRYYLGILATPSVFEGRCARRPEALAKKGTTYFLACGGKGLPVARFYVIEDSDQLDAITARIQQ